MAQRRADQFVKELDIKSADLQTECGKRQQKKRVFSIVSVRAIPKNLPAHLDWAVKLADERQGHTLCFKAPISIFKL